MPLLPINQPSDASLFVWHLTEPVTFFEEELAKDWSGPMPAFATERRYRHWLSARWICKRQGVGPVMSCRDGRPFLPHSDLHLSNSHSADLVAVMIAPRTVAVDIQRQEERIQRIAHRFLHHEERETGMEGLTRLWSAKEAVIKSLPGMTIDEMPSIKIQQASGRRDDLIARVRHEGINKLVNLRSQNLQVSGKPYSLACSN